MGSLDKYKIIPAVITNIEHRSECVPYYGAFWSTDADAWCLSGAYLPIFTAPMACVIDDKNYLEFDKNSIIPIIPRTVAIEKRLELAKQMVWVAMGLSEFSEFIKNNNSLSQETYICVDMANGHMKKLIDTCAEAKNKFGNNLILMTGNIANPLTYLEYAKAGIDYVRCSIGSGGACLTAKLTGIEYTSLGNLISECNSYKKYLVQMDSSEYKSIPKIIADGGLSSIRDIIVALALGADYVMCGKIFVKCEEAAGKLVPRIKNQIKTESGVYIGEPEYGRVYYGMSTERAQREMGNEKIKHSEGSEEWVPIEYKLKDWVSQFDAAISSAMSYCNKIMLSDFIGYGASYEG